MHAHSGMQGARRKQNGTTIQGPVHTGLWGLWGLMVQLKYVE